jgi:hypothetical protein
MLKVRPGQKRVSLFASSLHQSRCSPSWHNFLSKVAPLQAKPDLAASCAVLFLNFSLWLCSETFVWLRPAFGQLMASTALSTLEQCYRPNCTHPRGISLICVSECPFLTPFCCCCVLHCCPALLSCTQHATPRVVASALPRTVIFSQPRRRVVKPGAGSPRAVLQQEIIISETGKKAVGPW